MTLISVCLSMAPSFHELAHNFSYDSNVREDRAHVAAGWLYAWHLFGEQTESCSISEHFADLIRFFTVRRSSIASYLFSCNYFGSVLSDEALAVMDAVLAGQIPQWFYDTYQDSDGNLDREALWADILESRRAQDVRAAVICPGSSRLVWGLPARTAKPVWTSKAAAASWRGPVWGPV